MACNNQNQNPLILPYEVLETPARTKVEINDDRTEAVIIEPRQKVVIGGMRGPQGPKGDEGERCKGGWLTYTSFVGTPKKAPVTFEIEYPDTNYSIVVTGQDVRQWSVESQTPRGFVINSNADRPILNSVFWSTTSKWG